MFKIKIAELVIEIDNKYDFVKKQCIDYIVDDSLTADFTVSASEEQIKTENESSESNFSNGYLESVCIYRNIAYILPKFNAFLFHAAVVCVDGQAYAFTAKSGVGKSTHIRLWQNLLGEKLSIINGDKPILRIKDDKVYAYGTPWCGKEGYNINTSAPLKAICFINRGSVDEITPFEKSEAAGKVIHQIIVPKNYEDIVSILDMLDFTLKKVDVWKLKCTINISAAELSYNAMKGGQN